MHMQVAKKWNGHRARKIVSVFSKMATAMSEKGRQRSISMDPELSEPPPPPPSTYARILQDWFQIQKKVALEGTVGREIPQGIWWKVLLLCVYSALICMCNEYYVKLNFNLSVLPIMGTVVGFLLVFRTNTAYDRYYEGRKIWSSMTQVVRRLVTCIWIGVPAHCTEMQQEKLAIINCILAYPVAVKHHLREEYLYDHDDLRSLIGTFKPFASKFGNLPPESQQQQQQQARPRNIRRATRRFSSLSEYDSDSSGPVSAVANIPIELIHCISVYIQSLIERSACDFTTTGTMNNVLTRFVDDLGSLERILRTPLPLAYSVHLSQAVWIHLLVLPIQLVTSMSWWAIVAVVFTSFTLLGILQISSEIENPFGYDPNDLPLDHYCDALQLEVAQVVRSELRIYADLFYDPPPASSCKEKETKEEQPQVAPSETLPPVGEEEEEQGEQDPKLNEVFEQETQEPDDEGEENGDRQTTKVRFG